MSLAASESTLLCLRRAGARLAPRATLPSLVLVLSAMVLARLFAVFWFLPHQAVRRHLPLLQFPLVRLTLLDRVLPDVGCHAAPQLSVRGRSVGVTFNNFHRHHSLHGAHVECVLDSFVAPLFVLCHTELQVHGGALKILQLISTSAVRWSWPWKWCPSTANIGRYHLSSSCHSHSPAPSSAWTIRQRCVRTSTAVLVIRNSLMPGWLQQSL